MPDREYNPFSPTAGRREPADPDYRQKVESSFARQAAMRTLGVSIAALVPGAIELRLPFHEDLTQQHGYLHAGIVATVLDSACGYAAFSLMPAGVDVLSVEFKMNCLAPARGEHVRVAAEVVRSGRTLTVCQANAYGCTPGEPDTLVACMTGTMMSVAATR
jgi:uncharacterized protein (TIGR00369 family)